MYNMDDKEIKALHDLKEALLKINGALLRTGVNKDEVIVLLPDVDFVYMKRVLETSNTGLSKFYLKVCDEEFTLSGIKIRKYSKRDM